MSVSEALNKYKGLVSQVGKPVVSTLFPEDFESYTISLELINSFGDTKEFFIFPINPESLREIEQSNINIKRTLGGVTSIHSSQTPVSTITLSGNFGRAFKILIGRETVVTSGVSFNSKSFQQFKNGKVSKPEFLSNIKTGYGCIKILEKIVSLSQSPDESGRPHTLLLYNMASGNNFIVKTRSFDKNQSVSNNMIWNYTLQLEVIGRVEDFFGSSSNSIAKEMNTRGVIQEYSNKVLTGIRTSIKV